MITLSDWKWISGLPSVCGRVLPPMCSRARAHTHSPQKGGGTPGPPGLSKHQHSAPSAGGPRWETLRPGHRCEFLTAGEQSAATRSCRPRPAELPSFVQPGRHLFGFANILIHRNSRRGWGGGWGGALAVRRSPGLLQPPRGATAIRDMQWRAGATRTRRTGPAGGPALTGSAPPRGTARTGARRL